MGICIACTAPLESNVELLRGRCWVCERLRQSVVLEFQKPKDRAYRYLLWRSWTWVEPRFLLFCGLNPSKADAKRSDPTVSQMRGRAERLGYTGLLVVNAHALVSTDPLGMKQVSDPTGPDNLLWILRAARMSEFILCAWGNLAGPQGKAIEIMLRALNKPLYVLDLTKEGNPRHPRGVSLTVQPREWKISA